MHRTNFYIFLEQHNLVSIIFGALVTPIESDGTIEQFYLTDCLNPVHSEVPRANCT